MKYLSESQDLIELLLFFAFWLTSVNQSKTKTKKDFVSPISPDPPFVSVESTRLRWRWRAFTKWGISKEATSLQRGGGWVRGRRRSEGGDRASTGCDQEALAGLEFHQMHVVEDVRCNLTETSWDLRARPGWTRWPRRRRRGSRRRPAERGTRCSAWRWRWWWGGFSPVGQTASNEYCRLPFSLYNRLCRDYWGQHGYFDHVSCLPRLHDGSIDSDELYCAKNGLKRVSEQGW